MAAYSRPIHGLGENADTLTPGHDLLHAELLRGISGHGASYHADAVRCVRRTGHLVSREPIYSAPLRRLTQHSDAKELPSATTVQTNGASPVVYVVRGKCRVVGDGRIDHSDITAGIRSRAIPAIALTTKAGFIGAVSSLISVAPFGDVLSLLNLLLGVP